MNKVSSEKKSSLILAVALILGLVIGMVLYMALTKIGDYSNVISAFAGALVAIFIPLWQTYVIQKSRLSLEVNGISRKVSEKAKISLDEHSELVFLRKIKGREARTPFFIVDGLPKRTPPDRAISLDELEDLLNKAKQELKDAPEKIAERKANLEKINSFTKDNFTKYECGKLNRPLHPEIEYNPENVESTLEEFKKHFEESLSELKEKHEELQSSIPAIERKVHQIKTELIENRSFFEISATLINSGRLNTSIKRPALFRVYIGKENYIDLKLTLNDFEVKSEISPNSTVVSTFSSTDISQLPEEDRKLINTYWGQSVQCKLFVEDVHGEPSGSNSIAFSEGLYQKIIFDRLAVVATSHSI
ncbi:hypothetical protein DEO48_02450 [Enterobacter sp. CGMCC 5087]|uniref:hypothetical protein n=1 Tax=Enterobacter TaxID=547 RepID=UPI000D67C21B|nr:hypothetical protein [Enterobacter sp. CGMCC 5087]PWI81715.1 hypothetical protein DEO48_02450 [Enterobacter sp. CGMCC 5087]